MIIPKKSLGQNFLIDKNICKKISKIKNLYNQTIIEIGPGYGNLTDYIIKQKPKKTPKHSQKTIQKCPYEAWKLFFQTSGKFFEKFP